MGNYFNTLSGNNDRKGSLLKRINSKKLGSFKRRLHNNEQLNNITENLNKSNINYDILAKCTISSININKNYINEDIHIGVNYIEIKKYASNYYHNENNFEIKCPNSKDIFDKIKEIFELLDDFIGRDFKKYYFEIVSPNENLNDHHTLSILAGIFSAYYQINTNTFANLCIIGQVDKSGIVKQSDEDNIISKFYAYQFLPNFTHYLCSEDHKEIVEESKNPLFPKNIIYLRDYTDMIDFLLKFLNIK